MRRNFRIIQAVLVSLVFIVGGGSAWAQSSSSSNYRVDQTFFGSGGQDASSATYSAKQSAGELGIGNACSTDYCVWGGFNTTEDPYIEFVVTADTIDLGYLDTGTTKTANGTFAVRAWQASGYGVRTESDPPTNTNGGHQITPLASPSAPTPGQEEFGINLVKNETIAPCSAFANFGLDPIQSPDGSMAFGQVDSDYNQCGLFKYAKGDRVAYSDESTSITTYTVSYVFNINNVTAAGQYVFNHILVATGTY